MRKLKIIALVVFLQMQFGAGYVFAQTENITRQETLRGSVRRNANGGTCCITICRWSSCRKPED